MTCNVSWHWRVSAVISHPLWQRQLCPEICRQPSPTETWHLYNCILKCTVVMSCSPSSHPSIPLTYKVFHMVSDMHPEHVEQHQQSESSQTLHLVCWVFTSSARFTIFSCECWIPLHCQSADRWMLGCRSIFPSGSFTVKVSTKPFTALQLHTDEVVRFFFYLDFVIIC